MQIRIEVKANFDGAFNVGAGSMGGSLSRRPLLTDWRGLPLIPGSSFKGRLRHTCKQIAEGLGFPTCNAPYAEATCPNGPTPGGFCPVCRLFGSSQWPAPLIVTNLRLVEPEFLTRGTPPPTSLRYGVGISRRRRVAADQLLYDTEVFLPGGIITLRGEIKGQFEKGKPPVSEGHEIKLDDRDLGLLVAGLENLSTLGGGKTAGLGWCDLAFTVYEIADSGEVVERDPQEIKRSWLA